MRALKVGLALTLGVSMLAACGKKAEEPKAKPEAPAAAGMPKAGLWEMVISSPDLPAPQTIKTCMDQAMAAQAAAQGPQAGVKCSENKNDKQADGSYKVHSVCDMGTGGIVTTDGVMKGDPTSDFKISSTSVTTGAAAPQMNRTTTVEISSKWLGACPADMKPGDRELPGMSITMPK